MQRDKIYHFCVCLALAVIHPYLAIGASLGKEYGDMKAQGNHWCWYDLLADFCGIVLGSVVWYFWTLSL